MADAPVAREGTTTPSTRRQSFRKTLADAGLPQEYLDALEQKRKQLDDSIHKYIAAKERDYKAFEKELLQHYKFEQDRDQSSSRPRKITSQPTIEPSHAPDVQGQHQNALDALVAAGLRKDQLGQSVAVAVVEDDGPNTVLETRPNLSGLVDRHANLERDKDFIGVFTPAFLPALANKDEQSHSNGSADRSDSAPLIRDLSPETPDQDGFQRANSDSIIQAKDKRPLELQMPHRTSSSGSSADGRRSVLKSPTHPARPHQKRVSLAIGDSVVKPSDNVPSSMNSSNSTPSHSRTRSSSNALDDAVVAQAVESLNAVRDQARDSVMGSSSTSGLATSWAQSHSSPGSVDGKLAQSHTKAESTEVVPAAVTASLSTMGGNASTKPRIDPDGDLFDLHDEDDDSHTPNHLADDSLDSGDDVTGRVQHNASTDTEDEAYDDEAGLLPDHDSDDHADHVEFRPGSVSFSQQPTNPGFRRPSVSLDPVYRGQDYANAEHNAVTNETYGSSYSRPNKGSFTPGSLGESYMARNAELIRNRATEEQVRS